MSIIPYNLPDEKAVPDNITIEDCVLLLPRAALDTSPPNIETNPPASLTLATHGQRLEHLFGTNENDGILKSLMARGLPAYRLFSKEELRFLGMNVNSYSMFGGGSGSEAGESRISYYLNGLAGYGDVIWVNPAGKVTEKGCLVETRFNPSQTIGDQKGLSGNRGELGLYTPLGTSLNAALIYSTINERLQSVLIDLTSGGNSKSLLTGLLYSNFATAIGKLPRESFDEYCIRTFDTDLEGVNPAVLQEFISKLLVSTGEQFEHSMQFAEQLRGTAGINLADPFNICFVPEHSLPSIYEFLDQIKIIDESEREYIKRQFRPYNIPDGTTGEIDLQENLQQLSQNPRLYAEIVLENVRTAYNNPALNVEDVVVLLGDAERGLYPQNFTKIVGGVYPGLYCKK
jgi:hypothetical protein